MSGDNQISPELATEPAVIAGKRWHWAAHLAASAAIGLVGSWCAFSCMTAIYEPWVTPLSKWVIWAIITAMLVITLVVPPAHMWPDAIKRIWYYSFAVGLIGASGMTVAAHNDRQSDIAAAARQSTASWSTSVGISGSSAVVDLHIPSCITIHADGTGRSTPRLTIAVPVTAIPAFEAAISQLRGEPWRMPMSESLLREHPALASLARAPTTQP
jgi:hypothetical protein